MADTLTDRERHGNYVAMMAQAGLEPRDFDDYSLERAGYMLACAIDPERYGAQMTLDFERPKAPVGRPKPMSSPNVTAQADPKAEWRSLHQQHKEHAFVHVPLAERRLKSVTTSHDKVQRALDNALQGARYYDGAGKADMAKQYNESAQGYSRELKTKHLPAVAQAKAKLSRAQADMESIRQRKESLGAVNHRFNDLYFDHGSGQFNTTPEAQAAHRKAVIQNYRDSQISDRFQAGTLTEAECERYGLAYDLEHYVNRGFKAAPLHDSPGQQRLFDPQRAVTKTSGTWSAEEERKHPRAQGGKWGKKWGIQTEPSHDTPLFEGQDKPAEPVKPANPDTPRPQGTIKYLIAKLSKHPHPEAVDHRHLLEADPTDEVIDNAREFLSENRAEVDTSKDHLREWSVPDREGRRHNGAVVHPSSKVKGKWQVSRFDPDGFSGDSTYDSREAAVKDMRRDGYRPTEGGHLERLAATDQFRIGNDKTRIIGMLNNLHQQAGSHEALFGAYEKGGLDAAEAEYERLKKGKVEPEVSLEPAVALRSETPKADYKHPAGVDASGDQPADHPLVGQQVSFSNAVGHAGAGKVLGHGTGKNGLKYLDIEDPDGTVSRQHPESVVPVQDYIDERRKAGKSVDPRRVPGMPMDTGSYLEQAEASAPHVSPEVITFNLINATDARHQGILPAEYARMAEKAYYEKFPHKRMTGGREAARKKFLAANPEGPKQFHDIPKTDHAEEPAKRQSWQMTQAEFSPFDDKQDRSLAEEERTLTRAQQAEEKRMGKRSKDARVPPAITSDLSGQSESKLDKIDTRLAEIRKQRGVLSQSQRSAEEKHPAAVEHAHKTGEKVPDEVLADYPHLQPERHSLALVPRQLILDQYAAGLIGDLDLEKYAMEVSAQI